MKKLGLTGTRARAQPTPKKEAHVAGGKAGKKRGAAAAVEEAEDGDGDGDGEEQEGSVEPETPTKKVKKEA